jgi:hypothetical protein
LASLDLCCRELMPVNPDVGARKRGAPSIGAIAVSEIAFHFEIELLGKIAGQIDPCPAQSKTILDFGLTKIPVESKCIAAFGVKLDKSAEHQFQFRSTLLNVNRLFLFDHRLLRIRLSVIRHLSFKFRVGRIRSLFGLQAVHLRFQFRILFLEQLHCALELFDSV